MVDAGDAGTDDQHVDSWRALDFIGAVYRPVG
jgi:hypothetical protein